MTAGSSIWHSAPSASEPLSFSGNLGTRQEEFSGWTVMNAPGPTWKPNRRFSLDLDLNYNDRNSWLLNYPGRDFVINRMTVQLRYRWQIAPQPDLFVVYTRRSTVRYRFGT